MHQIVELWHLNFEELSQQGAGSMSHVTEEWVVTKEDGSSLGSGQQKWNMKWNMSSEWTWEYDNKECFVGSHCQASREPKNGSWI